MTAINIAQKRDAIIVMTDGLAQRTDGAPAQIAPKIALLPHIPLAVAVRGFAGLPHLITTKLIEGGVSNFDEVLGAIPIVAKAFVPEMQKHFGVEMRQEIYVAGYSEARKRLELHFLCSDDSYAVLKGLPAYELRLETEEAMASPRPSDENAAKVGFRMPKIAQFETGSHGVRLMDAQRLDHPAGIGAFCHVTTVTRDGITSRTVKRWALPAGGGENPQAA